MGNSAVQLLTGNAPAAGVVVPAMIAATFGGFFRNKIINGDFRIAQRNTTFSSPATATYTLDRWVVTYDGTIGAFTLSRQTFTPGQTDVPDEPIYFMRWNHTSAGSGSTFRRISQKIESCQSLAGKNATVTFYAKADIGRNVVGALVQNFGSGGSAAVSTALGTFSLTSSWQKFTATVAVPSVSGKTIGAGDNLELRLDLPINATMTIEIAHVQVEENGGTPFEQRPVGLEQNLCERYYQVLQMFVGATSVSLPFKSGMMATPTVGGGGSGFASSSVSVYGGSCSQTTGANQTITLEAEL